MNKLIGVAALAVTLPFIAACGDYGAGAEATPTTTPTPTTERVRKVVEYRNRNVEVTPAACLEALDIAEEVYDIAADISYAASDGFGAAADFDAAGIRDATRRIEAANEELGPMAPRWQTARDECKAAAD